MILRGVGIGLTIGSVDGNPAIACSHLWQWVEVVVTRYQSLINPLFTSKGRKSKSRWFFHSSRPRAGNWEPWKGGCTSFLIEFRRRRGCCSNMALLRPSTQQQMSCNRIRSLRICSEVRETKPNDCQNVSSDSRGCGGDTLSNTDCSALHPGGKKLGSCDVELHNFSHWNPVTHSETHYCATVNFRKGPTPSFYQCKLLLIWSEQKRQPGSCVTNSLLRDWYVTIYQEGLMVLQDLEDKPGNEFTCTSLIARLHVPANFVYTVTICNQWQVDDDFCRYM